MNPDEIAELVVAKVERTAEKVGSGFPHLTENGRWRTTRDGGWTGGFWIGILWLTHLMTGDKKFADLTCRWLPRLEQRKSDRMFDLGFLFYPSFVLGYRITGDEYLKRVSLEAAETMADLSHGRSGFICQEVQADGRRLGRTCIDVMMDLALLWWPTLKQAGRSSTTPRPCTRSEPPRSSSGRTCRKSRPPTSTWRPEKSSGRSRSTGTATTRAGRGG